MNLPFIRINPLGMLVLCLGAIFFIFVYISRLYSSGHDTTTLISLKHILSVAVTSAQLGGLKVREIRQSSDLKQSSKGKTKEGADEYLTMGDLLSHRAMMYNLKKSFPKLQIISEEHEENQIQPEDIGMPVSTWVPVDNFADDVEVPLKDILVWIDPLDATQEYTEKLTEYVTTMVCVAVKGKPVIGVIHQPFKNVTVWGWVGKGTSNSELASALDIPDPSKPATIIVSRSHSGDIKEVARKAFGENTVIVTAGGSGYKSLQVAQGKADAYIHITLIKKWDICAGNALITALGGKMTTLDGAAIDYGSSIMYANEKGLVVTLHDHEKVLEKLSSLPVKDH